MKYEMMDAVGLSVQEAGSLVCVQEKLKQLQADIDCILKACYGECQGEDGGPCGRGKPDCDSLQVCLMFTSCML